MFWNQVLVVLFDVMTVFCSAGRASSVPVGSIIMALVESVGSVSSSPGTGFSVVDAPDPPPP